MTPLSHAFKRTGLTMVRGENATLYDAQSRSYTDLTGGLGTAIVGHANPAVAEAIYRQTKQLINASNAHVQDMQLEFAKTLATHSGMDRLLLTNSGTEAIEAALKLTRKNGTHVIACHHAFHGRSFGALSITHNPAYTRAFEPLVPQVTHIPFNDANALEHAITKNTAAFIVEPIQGESGVITPNKEYLKHVAETCSKKDVLLVLDEVQTAYRTGTWLAFQHTGIQPDIVATAKPLANGLPLGATMYREDLDFQPGEHGSTFGGNPVCCAAAHATSHAIESQNLHQQTHRIHNTVSKRLIEMGLSPRGQGAMIGVDCQNPFGVQERAQKNGVLVSVCHQRTLRFLPPLTITESELNHALNVLENCLT